MDKLKRLFEADGTHIESTVALAPSPGGWARWAVVGLCTDGSRGEWIVSVSSDHDWIRCK